MEVSDYNKGRKLSDISGKTYIHGTRKYLRPDTLWADERYSSVTQDEINQAKKRYADRSSRKTKVQPKKHHHDAHESHDYAFVGAEKKLYY